MSKGELDRRDFVRQASTAIAMVPLASILGSCAALAARVVPTTNGQLQLALTHYPELATPGGALKIRPDGGESLVYILALESGEYAALSPICTHLGCTVEVQGARIVCPCHGSTYDRAGRVLQGPAERALTRYPVRVSADGVLSIDLRGGA